MQLGNAALFVFVNAFTTTIAASRRRMVATVVRVRFRFRSAAVFFSARFVEASSSELVAIGASNFVLAAGDQISSDFPLFVGPLRV
jgi:hypothetical protein